MRDNPVVNRYLKDKAMDRIDHALGRPTWPLRETYRNHYATNASGPLAREFISSPNWEPLGQRDDMAFFAVTETGRQVLTEHLARLDAGERDRAYIVTFQSYRTIVPAKSRAHARYSQWLSIRDVYSELTFGEFIKDSSVRVAA